MASINTPPRCHCHHADAAHPSDVKKEERDAMCHACSCSARVPNGARMTPLHKDMSRSGLHMGDGDKGMNQTDRVARVSHMDVHSAKESGSQKMPGGRPRRQLFRPRHTPGQTEVGRNWPPNLLMITERGTREESAFFQPSRFHIRHQGRPRSPSKSQTNNNQ